MHIIRQLAALLLLILITKRLVVQRSVLIIMGKVVDKFSDVGVYRTFIRDVF